MQSFLNLPADAAADAIEQRLNALADGEVKHLFLNALRTIAQLEKRCADLENKVFNHE